MLLILQLPVSSYFPIVSIHIYFKFWHKVLTFNNLIPNNYSKFVFLTIISTIIGTKFSAETAAIFRTDVKKAIEHSFETSPLIQITWRHTLEVRHLQAYIKKYSLCSSILNLVTRISSISEGVMRKPFRNDIKPGTAVLTLRSPYSHHRLVTGQSYYSPEK